MMLVLLLIVMKSKGKGRIRVFVAERRRRRERNVWKNKSGLLFIHRRIRNYEIPKIPLVQFTGYYI